RGGRGTGRRDDRQARRAVRRERAPRAGADAGAETALRRPPPRAAFVALTLVLIALPAGAQRLAPDQPARIEIAAKTIDSFSAGVPDQVRFGAVEFRGGLELTSPHPQFGGPSALRVARVRARVLS